MHTVRVRRKKDRYVKILIAASIYIGACVLLGFARFASSNGESEPTGLHSGPSRRLLADNTSGCECNDATCIPRSIGEFPGDFLTLEQRQDGLVFVHCLIVLYIFGCLAIVCDDYFIASLGHICSGAVLGLGLKEDVAGATLMAAGSSAPELATSVIAVFVAKSDVGIGTIVGSAVFNILIITAICSLFGGKVIPLTWWPLVRDCCAYTISIVLLIIVIDNEDIEWWEAMIMIIAYALYILLMYFNPTLSVWATNKVSALKKKYGFYSDSSYNTITCASPLIGANYKTVEEMPSTEEEGCKDLMFGEDQEDDEGYQSPFVVPDTLWRRTLWVLLLPVSALMHLTIPDCRKGGIWHRLYVVTFIMSVAWITGLSYIMVWMVTIVGDTWEIPDSVMGLTFLAAGTSVPDALSSLFVARDGFGDMAISNSVGSNIFDILLCLGLPWLLRTTIPQGGSHNTPTTITVSSKTLSFISVALLASVVFILLGVAINGWKLNKKLGFTCLLVYAVFMVFSLLYELNVFVPCLNPCMCPREN